LLRRAVSNRPYAPQSAVIVGEDVVAVQSKEGAPVADSSEPKSDMLVKAESLKPADEASQATAIAVPTTTAIHATKAVEAKAAEVTPAAADAKPAEQALEVKALEARTPDTKAPEARGVEAQAEHGAATTPSEIIVPTAPTGPQAKVPEIIEPPAMADAVKPTDVEKEAKKQTSQADHANAVELPAVRFGEDDEPVMMATSYPGDEWIPRWDPE
jgi:hypothetical protein